MEFRCEHCDYVGAPSGVEPTSEGGVAMICNACGKPNKVSLTATPSVETDETIPQKTSLTEKPPITLKKIMPKASEDLTETAYERLLPERGDGFRCPKCIRLIQADFEHCPHCGLQIDAGVRHGENAPWDRPPEGKDAEFEQAVLLWGATAADPTDENFRKFVDFTTEHQLYDLETRRLRWFLVDNPDHEVALGHLKKVAEKFQSSVAIAEATSKARARTFEDDAQRFRQKLMIGTAIFWAILVVVVGFSFLNSC